MEPVARKSCRADLADAEDELTGFGARNAAASPPPSTAKPRGLSRSEAILARILLGESPIDTVMPSSLSTSAVKRARTFAGVSRAVARCLKIEIGLVDRHARPWRERPHHLADRGGYAHISPCWADHRACGQSRNASTSASPSAPRRGARYSSRREPRRACRRRRSPARRQVPDGRASRPWRRTRRNRHGRSSVRAQVAQKPGRAAGHAASRARVGVGQTIAAEGAHGCRAPRGPIAAHSLREFAARRVTNVKSAPLVASAERVASAPNVRRIHSGAVGEGDQEALIAEHMFENPGEKAELVRGSSVFAHGAIPAI